ncbi:MAG: type II toxin-antitoxin system prevent-host-death family antitoxin [Pirellulales bacterium]|nr:type II toxin-antitoxin system prevent-host-death family antitoxin [Pirellulales bacterium]
MTAVSLDAARADLDGLLARVLADAEPIVLNTADGGSVVLMPLGDFTSWQETAYLLRSPANAARLRESLAQYERGQVSERQIDEE